MLLSISSALLPHDAPEEESSGSRGGVQQSGITRPAVRLTQQTDSKTENKRITFKPQFTEFQKRRQGRLVEKQARYAECLLILFCSRTVQIVILGIL